MAAPARALLSGRGGSAIWAPLLAKLDSKEIDPSFVIAHRVSLEEAPAAYATFRDKKEGCVEVVLRP